MKLQIMEVNIEAIADFQPQLAILWAGAEPSVRDILTYYYTSHGIHLQEAQQAANLYIKELKKEFEK